MADVRAPQGGTFAVYNMPAERMNVPQAAALEIYRAIAADIHVTQAVENVTYSQVSQGMQATQAATLAVYRGRIANPRLRAWTCTLDGHDFYVLRLGDKATLVYDLATEQWTEWTSSDLNFWRLNCGITWPGAISLADEYGSTVVVGDDLFGLLWFLDPKQPYDQHPDVLNARQQIPFPRILSGQVLASGRDNIPCYVLFVDGDNYGLTSPDFVPTVTLETSDDEGRTFETHDTLTVNPDFSQPTPYAWYSLGQISAPGRIFRLTDTGVFTRVDSMGMNDDAR